MSRARVAIVLASEPRDSGSIVSAESARAVLAPVMTASGVRRSCEIEASRVLRSDSVSAETRADSAASARCARSIASAIWPANVSSR